jgi:hypothetical protein
MVESESLHKTGTGIYIPPVLPTATWPQMLSLDIHVSVSLVYVMASQAMLKSAITNIFLMFYPVFAQPFNSVTVVFKDTPDSRSFQYDVANDFHYPVHGGPSSQHIRL